MNGLLNIVGWLLLGTGTLLAGEANEPLASNLPKWRVTVRVVDEEGKPVAYARASVWYYILASQGESVAMTNKTGLTDADGVFVASEQNGSIELNCEARKDGYYPSGLVHEFSKFRKSDPMKWNSTVVLTLKRIGRPVPLFARKVELKVPEENREIGFDLLAGDWVAPYGNGKNADFLFTVTRKIEGVSDYKAEMRLSFPHKGDGIVVMSSQRNGGSELDTPRAAPSDGYEPERIWHYTSSAKPDPVFGYFFRVRSVLAENGVVQNALYGEIRGDFRFYIGIKAPRAGMGFDYYLNPALNDQNLEFDPMRNLFPNLPFDLRIRKP